MGTQRNENVLGKHLVATQERATELLKMGGASDMEIETAGRAVTMARLQLRHYQVTGEIVSGYELFKKEEAV